LPLVHIRLIARRPTPYREHPRTLGERIKKRRIELGLTQAEAAKRLAVNSRTVLNWEIGRYDPPIRSMPTILSFLGYDPFSAPGAVCECLLRKRRENGWSTSEAARELGVDPTTWQDWERGHVILFREHRNRVAKLLGLDPQELTAEMRTRWNGKHQRWERCKS
jgi:transcriptional regulator with XRE-family HTH domain